MTVLAKDPRFSPGAYPQTAPPLTLGNLGPVVLRTRDNDAAHCWGATTMPHRGGTPVAELQRALKAVGLYTGPIDGVFGKGSALGLQRFTWFIRNSDYRLRVPAGGTPASGTVASYVQNPAIALTDKCDALLAAELLSWVGQGVNVTTLLVRVPLSRFDRISRGVGFATLNYPDANGDEVLASKDFVAGLDSLDDAAGTNDVKLSLNQTFRVQNMPPSGAVVTPATRSQHLIGHAVDLNIVDGKTTVTSAMFINKTATDAANKLVADAKATGLRWGGDFSPIDPPHFDLQVPANNSDYDMKFFFCQRFYALNHPIRLA